MNSMRTLINLPSDPLLPQRDILLNTDEVARRLESRLGTTGDDVKIVLCERLRTKYRLGDSLRVLHRISIGDSDYSVAARAFPKGQSEQVYKRALAASVTCAPLRPVIHDSELETVFWTFPNDRKLSGLQALTNIPPELGQLFEPGWTSSHLVAYAPEKSATAECLDDNSNVLAYAKIYQGDEGKRVFAVYHALRQRLSSNEANVAFPRALAYSKVDKILLLEAVEGERIANLHLSDVPSAYERLGSALAKLHSLPLPEDLPRFKRLDVSRVQQAAETIGQARPDLKREALDLAAKLALQWKSPSDPPVCLHGDVHAKNAIFKGDSVTLIDLDQAALGSPAADVGSLLASLAYSHLTDSLSHASSLECAASFLTGYASERELPQTTSWSWYTAAALLAERALRAINRIRPEGLEHMSDLLVEANHFLEFGGNR